MKKRVEAQRQVRKNKRTIKEISRSMQYNSHPKLAQLRSQTKNKSKASSSAIKIDLVLSEELKINSN